MAVQGERNNISITRRKKLQSNELSNSTPPIDNSDASVKTLHVMNSPERLLFCALFLFRILNALLIKTFFVPDEFWQGPEIAHRMVFGYGYLTWEWQKGLRGWTSPLMYAAGYKLLALFELDTANTVVVVPRLIQSCFASLGDLFLYKLAVKRFDYQTGSSALFCYLLSWFTFYVVTRTLTNSLETVLTTIALYYWPVDAKKEITDPKQVIKALGFAAFSCVVRPTSAIVWIPLSIWHLFLTPKKITFLLKYVFPVGCLAILWSVLVNSWLYGKWTCVELNFVKFNVINDMGTFYGSHPWHWYFTQGFPVVMFTHMVPFIGGILKAAPGQRMLALLILWIIIIYSFLGHKEFRFIFPVVPLAMCYCGLCLSCLSEHHLSEKQASSQGILKGISWYGWKAKLLVLFLAITNIPLALYTSTVHQKGAIDVMDHIQAESANLASDNDMSVLFLMPCHSSPYYSFIHRNISMRILECPPSDKPGYTDEADQFFLNPLSWLVRQFGNYSGNGGQAPLPSHIVLYNVLLPDVSTFLDQFQYRKDAEFFHTHFPEGRIGSKVLVYVRDNTGKQEHH